MMTYLRPEGRRVSERRLAGTRGGAREPGAALAFAGDLRVLAHFGLIEMRADGGGDVRCELTDLGRAADAGAEGQSGPEREEQR